MITPSAEKVAEMLERERAQEPVWLSLDGGDTTICVGRGGYLRPVYRYERGIGRGMVCVGTVGWIDTRTEGTLESKAMSLVDGRS